MGIANEMTDSDRNWMGIKGARWIWHGEWADPEVVYRGYCLDYFDIEQGLLELYRQENPGDRNDEGFDDWMREHPDDVKDQLDLLADAAEEAAQEEGEVEEADEFQENRKMNTKIVLVRESDGSLRKVRIGANESLADIWNATKNTVKDNVKAAKDGIKNAAGKVAKAIGDWKNGPWRKGDQVELVGDDGKKFRGAITKVDWGNRQYTFMLNQMAAEGTEWVDIPDAE